jgi:hypothetical protein
MDPSCPTCVPKAPTCTHHRFELYLLNQPPSRANRASKPRHALARSFDRPEAMSSKRDASLGDHPTHLISHETLPYTPCASCTKKVPTVPGAMETLPCRHAIHRACLKRCFGRIREQGLGNARSPVCRLCPPQIDDTLESIAPRRSV